MFKSYLLVAVGSALGGVARVALSGGIYRRWGTSFPWGTLVVNLVGCFLIGVFFSWAEIRLRLSPAARLFLMAGFCGGFTTFSTFALETTQLMRAGAPAAAIVYAIGSAVLGVALFWMGSVMGR
ncbi:MAG: fluoride efflux transporter CrcB [Elusimicrobia bacterium]|nr:fluoride efflux transporter CrcB [Elusimicrobiota bacterium]